MEIMKYMNMIGLAKDFGSTEMMLIVRDHVSSNGDTMEQ